MNIRVFYSTNFSQDCLQEMSSVSKNVGLKMKQMLKPKAVPIIFLMALPNCSFPPEKRRHTAFEKGERSSVSYSRYYCIVDENNNYMYIF